MIKSMTGFGAAEGDVGSAHVSVEIRSVNHRFFSPSIKLPGAFARWEGDVREALRRAVSRGHVTLMARVDRQSTAESRIDEARFASYVGRLQELQRRYGVGGELDMATLLRLPDVVTTEEAEAEEGTAAQLVAIVDRAASALDAMRRSEGERGGPAMRVWKRSGGSTVTPSARPASASSRSPVTRSACSRCPVDSRSRYSRMK